MKVGNVMRYMKNICLEGSFNIQFFSDANCTVELDDASFRSLYTYEWDKCYKRTDTEYMIIENPWKKAMAARMKDKEPARDEPRPGPVSMANGLFVAASTMALSITSDL